MFPLPAANLLTQQAGERVILNPSLTLFEVALF
jgi:hypothetical protein